MKTRLMAMALATCAPLLSAPAGALPVFDATNYAQNLLQAARALEQIDQQMRSLQNQAQMLRNMDRNLQRVSFPELQRMTDTLHKVDGLIDQAKGVDFRIDGLDARLRSMFPGELTSALDRDASVAAARARLEAADEALRRSMAVQAQVAGNVKEDAGLLAGLAGRSDGAGGALEAQQASNQLLALSAKQQLQLETLLAAEFRSQGLERARAAQAESDARAATRRFLGTGRAYTR